MNYLTSQQIKKLKKGDVVAVWHDKRVNRGRVIRHIRDRVLVEVEWDWADQYGTDAQKDETYFLLDGRADIWVDNRLCAWDDDVQCQMAKQLLDDTRHVLLGGYTDAWSKCRQKRCDAVLQAINPRSKIRSR